MKANFKDNIFQTWEKVDKENEGRG